jgi:hypothetical protein
MGAHQARNDVVLDRLNEARQTLFDSWALTGQFGPGSMATTSRH